MLRIWELKNEKKFCDVMIIADKSVIYAHSCILAASSPILLDKLMTLSPQDWSVKNPLKIDISNLVGCKDYKMNCMDCLSKMIDHMYSVKIDCNTSHFDHLLELSRLLQLSDFISSYKNLSIVKSDQSNAKRKINFPKMKPEKKSSLVKSNFSKSVCMPNNNPKLSNSDFLNEKCTVSENLNKSENMVNIESNEVSNLEKATKDHGTIEVNSVNETHGDFNCLKCKINFDCFKVFNYHKKIFHKKKFLCLSCNFTTLKLSYMVFHLTNTDHPENYCSICLYNASDKKSLQAHLIDHKNDLPYKCYICDTAFRSRTEWLKHSVWHNQMDKSLICKICGDSFGSKLDMNSHLLTHKDTALHTCELCGFVAQDKDVLLKHAEKHKRKKIKRFSCPVNPCQFNTMYKYNLKDHLKSHEVTKSFICQMCSIKFTLEKNLLRHLKTMHNEQNTFYECCRCDYKNARIDKAKIHCETSHPEDPEALLYLMKQHYKRKATQISIRNKKCDAKDQCKVMNNKNYLTQANDKRTCEITDSNLENISKCPSEAKGTKTFILSETTGEFHLISENKGEPISVASVTSTNVLTIGNFREGTGSVTLNETTGVLTLNNINSESTGAVFLNESTGELSYINLGNDTRMNVDHADCKDLPKVQIQLNECTGEMFTVSNENEIPDFNEDDALFDSFDMDIGDDSCDGFDDLDGLLFDSIDFENSDIFLSKNQESNLTEIPHLNETTGELSFDHVDTQSDPQDLWSIKHCSQQGSEEDSESSYTRLLLDEVTGELMTGEPK